MKKPRMSVTLAIARHTFAMSFFDPGPDRSMPLVRYEVNGMKVLADEFDRCMRMVEMGARVESEDEESQKGTIPIT